MRFSLRPVVLAVCLLSLSSAAAQEGAVAPLTVEITSPLGRTGLTGPIRIVARVTAPANAAISPVQFFVDGKLVGEDKDAPYAVEWTDANPFEAREITAQVADALGNTASGAVRLKPLEVTDKTSVSSVIVEPSVLDAKGRSIAGLTAADFKVYEDGVAQAIDAVIPDRVPATYTLLIDTSQSMSRRMQFVRDAARRLPERLRPDDHVVIAPFSRMLGTVTGPTKDQDTIAGAIDAITPAGGTAILDSLAAAAEQMRAIEGHHVIVLITDGYDEHSGLRLERSLAAIKATNATVYVIGVAGVAGISLDGEDLLRRIASDTGGRAFFPSRDFQLTDVNGLIADDVQLRYLLTYTPSNQRLDGTWREIKVETVNPEHTVRARAGYFAPAPPPIKPQLELTIRDLDRRFVELAAEDLIVVEDGVEQTVEVFQEQLAPVSIALLLDASGSMRRDAPIVVEAANSFVNALPGKDKLAVMLFADAAEFAHDLSTLRLWSLDAIQKYQASGGTALYDALTAGLDRLRHVEGRRAVVVFTDGRDENNPGTGPGSVSTYEDVLASLKQTEALIFSIGLGPNVDRAKLEEIAALTGGEAYFPENVATLDANYRRILENLRRRYIIGYTSTNSTHDGAWRTVEIRSRRSGVVIESKGGYFAPDDGKRP
jgi:Ca-activated chloride channel family protein